MVELEAQYSLFKNTVEKQMEYLTEKLETTTALLNQYKGRSRTRYCIPLLIEKLNC